MMLIVLLIPRLLWEISVSAEQNVLVFLFLLWLILQSQENSKSVYDNGTRNILLENLSSTVDISSNVLFLLLLIMNWSPTNLPLNLSIFQTDINS